MTDIKLSEVASEYIGVDYSRIPYEAKFIKTISQDEFYKSENAKEIIEFIFKISGGRFGQLPVQYQRVRQALPRLFDDAEIVVKHKQWVANDRRIPKHFLNPYVRQFWGRDILFELEYKQKGYVPHGLNPVSFSYIPQFELDIDQATKLGVGPMIDDDIDETALEMAALRQLVAVYKSEEIGTSRTGSFVEYLALKIIKSIPFQFLFPECVMRPHTSLRTLAESIWPNTRYQRQRHGALLIKALKELHSTRFYIKDIGWWSPIHIRLLPDIPNDTDIIMFDVLLPPKCSGGVLLDDINIANARIHGTWAMRLDTAIVIHLSNLRLLNNDKKMYVDCPKVLRDSNGYLVSKDGERLPTKHWNSKEAVRLYDNQNHQLFEPNSYAIRKVRPFNSIDLFHLAFPNEPYHDDGKRASIRNRKRLAAIKRYIRSMESDRRIGLYIESDNSVRGKSELWRILHCRNNA